jgi:hypothetical protein
MAISDVAFVTRGHVDERRGRLLDPEGEFDYLASL